MKSKLTSGRLRIRDPGVAEGAASEATFRAGIAGRFTVGSFHDPYNSVRAERAGNVKRTDLRELSRQILQRREGS